MGDRRMFSMQIVDSDAFLDMPLSTQALYFHLSMRADDDGFVDNARKIVRAVGCSQDDVKLLFAKNFVIAFDDGVCVIKHWRIHNYIRTDRKKTTAYIEHFDKLDTKENGSYTLKKSDVSQVTTTCLPSDNQMSAQVKLGKVNISKANINTLSGKTDSVYEEVIDYLNEKAETQYRSSSAKTKSLIQARVNDGFTLDDFKKVIDKKVSEWKNTEMAKFIRPETLFGTKFESYLNQKKGKTLDVDWLKDHKMKWEE
jgi:uncharacterized phage protein (TIGR02220 family)